MNDAPPAWAVFSGTSRRSSSTLSALATKRLEPAAPAQPAPPDLDAIAAAARDEGRREGEALAARAAQAALAAEREAAAAALAETRRSWVAAEAAVLASALTEQIQAAEARLADSLARVLRPFLTEALRQDAVREVRALLTSLAAEDRAGTVTIAGPADLTEALARHLDLPPGRLTVVGDGRPDLRIRMNGTLIETRLQAWGERLAALVEDL
jgi:hypothetical protein